MKKVFLHLNETEYNNRIKSHTLLHSELEDILNAYNSLGLPSVNASEFKELVNSPLDFVFDKMTGGKDFEFGGHPVDKKQARNLISKPEGFEHLASLISTFKVKLNSEYHLGNINIIEGELCLCPTVREREKENCSVYAKTEKQLKAYQFAKAVLDKVEELYGSETIPDIGTFVNELLPPIVSFAANNRIKINYAAIGDYEMKYGKIATLK